MASVATTCLPSTAFGDGTAECRVSLVPGDAFLFAGCARPSHALHRRARSAAGRTDHRAEIGALTYIRADLHVAVACIRRLNQELRDPDAECVWTEVESAVNCQAIVVLKYLEPLLQSAHFDALITWSIFAAALPIIDEVPHPMGASDSSAQRVALRVEGALSPAMPETTIDVMNEVDSFAPDGRTLIPSSMRDAFKICDRLNESAHHDFQIKNAIAECVKVMNRLKSSLLQSDSCSHQQVS